ncbi:MAG TPA: hypothetical protein VFP32_00975 [Candidatus Saccharimonadales bacterium]|nr:hypothetical protein [Candidatus Saccharimonadales bacterium]
MNPAKTLHATPQRTERLMQDVVAPAPASAAPAKPQSTQPAVAADGTPQTLSPELVHNIPLKVQAGATAKPVNPDAELDKIMHEVDNEKKTVSKHHFFSKNPKPQTKEGASNPSPAAPRKSPSPQAQKANTQAPKPAIGFPITAFSVTVVVTAFLVITAYYAYR